ncbi:MAG: ChaN family lipoprotein [Kofleriaceae bacterium]|nr:ChaN family lipoprotein [Kofleriaceae bacterium]
MRSIAIAAVPLALVAGCGGHYATSRPDGAPRGVEAAVLPYAIVDGRTGKAVDEDQFWAALDAARVVCVGEEHPNPHHHWVQLQVVDHLSSRRTVGFGVGMEMVQRPYQGVLDDFAAGRIDEAALLSRVGWEDRWGYDWKLYQPILTRAVAHRAALVALNAPRELTKKVVREGLAALTAEERAQVPELVLDDAQHRRWFDGVMSAMGGADAHSSTHAAPPDAADDAADADADDAGGEPAPAPAPHDAAAPDGAAPDGAAAPPPIRPRPRQAPRRRCRRPTRSTRSRCCGTRPWRAPRPRGSRPPTIGRWSSSPATATATTRRSSAGSAGAASRRWCRCGRSSTTARATSPRPSARR